MMVTFVPDAPISVTMSVAFTREEDLEATAADLPDRPISPHPNLVTPEGLAAIEAELASARAAYTAAQVQGSIESDRTAMARFGLSVSQINRNSSIQFGKSLKYKYRPKVRYSYEFISNERGKYAVLKISSRTKSENLNDHFNEFFNLITFCLRFCAVIDEYVDK